MNLQPTGLDRIYGQEQFLRNSVGIEYKTGGATLDHTTFSGVTENGYIKAGTAVFLNETTGLYNPWDTTAETGTPATANGAGLTSHDVKLVEGSNPIVGVLVAGHPLEDKCTAVNDTFKEAVRGYLRFDA